MTNRFWMRDLKDRSTYRAPAASSNFIAAMSFLVAMIVLAACTIAVVAALWVLA